MISGNLIARGRSFLTGTILLCTLSFAQVGTPVPVLCYHGFADDTTAIQGKLTEKYRRFDEMLQFLSSHGYQTVFPEELDEVDAPIKKPIILTFDDGRKDQLRAAEMMKERGMRGIFFIVPSRISSGRAEFMTNDDIALLSAQGHQIGVHGSSHRSMVESPEEKEAVRTQALSVIKDAVPSQTVFPSFAYPFGHYDTSVVEVVTELYRYLHTVSPGYWDRRSHHIPRMLITSDKPVEFLQDYVLRSYEFRASLNSLIKDGAQASVVPFRIVGRVSVSGLNIIAVSADREGYHYSSHSAVDVVSIRESVLRFDIRKFLKLYFQETRAVLSYAFVTGEGSSLRFLSLGQTHWVNNGEKNKLQ
ncbi:MAG TPA: polysaccharide deacetylase family protein [Bacteroidota bacterium]|nr:polysaccharide deacetylase family protein [Bacteroidota bacterium]